MGLKAARSKVYYFRHNDPIDLELQILTQALVSYLLFMHYIHIFIFCELFFFFLKKKPRRAGSRKFILVEGIYEKTGQICDLASIVSLREKYELRLILDETHSLGVLGKTGRGVMEHLKIDVRFLNFVSFVNY